MEGQIVKHTHIHTPTRRILPESQGFWELCGSSSAEERRRAVHQELELRVDWECVSVCVCKALSSCPAGWHSASYKSVRAHSLCASASSHTERRTDAVQRCVSGHTNNKHDMRWSRNSARTLTEETSHYNGVTLRLRCTSSYTQGDTALFPFQNLCWLCFVNFKADFSWLCYCSPIQNGLFECLIYWCIKQRI